MTRHMAKVLHLVGWVSAVQPTELVSRWWVAFRYAPLTHPTNSAVPGLLSGHCCFAAMDELHEISEAGVFHSG